MDWTTLVIVAVGGLIGVGALGAQVVFTNRAERRQRSYKAAEALRAIAIRIEGLPRADALPQEDRLVVSDDLNTLMEEEILPHGDNAFGSNDPRPWSATDSRFDALPSRSARPGRLRTRLAGGTAESNSRVDARSAAARRDRMGMRC